ncbi:helix-turn-helix domain-containing protein [Flavobacterium sp. UBA6135]|uniref:helix-turn-helix domain-containing protein n=1 Tax=Flavobacterium sp. UBA6135 TaxID=1946553 RepID=UPI0025C72798|nr:helix-turn-helix domain-containing protein [Flavobacterium sp. UBA6135]
MDYYEKTAKQIQQLLDKVDEISSMIKTRSGFDAEDVYIDNNEFLQLFKVSRRTAQHWRDSGIIGHTMIGSKIYYCLADVHKMMKENYKQRTK